MDADRERRTRVRVEPETAIESAPGLFAALEAAFAVRFAAADRGAEAVLVVGEGDSLPGLAELARSGLPALAIGAPRPPAAARELRFGDRPPLDRRLHGIRAGDPLGGPDLGAPAPAEEVVAAAGATAAWTISGGPAPVHRVRASLPELGPDQTLRELLDERPLALAALVQFLRSVEGPAAHPRPRLRAALLFDDPNLRWRTYGFIEYRRLLDHADAHGYHVAMAMVPLDGRWQHRPTVELFRRRADRLSLVLHGNNHVSRELMRPGDEAAAVGLAAQALRRATRFQARYGLAIDRVMTPPHGLCSESSARALGALGYDALCSIFPFPWSERAPAGRPLTGWEPAEFGAGCAVIPRVHLPSAGEDELALRAFLGQPLVLYGHHDDLADGLDLLADAAGRVNRLGEVEWTSLGRIAAGNYSLARDGALARVRPYAHRLRVDVPEGAESIVVEPPRGADGVAGWSLDGSRTLPFGAAAGCRPGQAEIRLVPSTAIDPERVPAPRRSVWPLLRRVATEGRDRLSASAAARGVRTGRFSRPARAGS